MFYLKNIVFFALLLTALSAFSYKRGIVTIFNNSNQTIYALIQTCVASLGHSGSGRTNYPSNPVQIGAQSAKDMQYSFEHCKDSSQYPGVAFSIQLYDKYQAWLTCKDSSIPVIFQFNGTDEHGFPNKFSCIFQKS